MFPWITWALGFFALLLIVLEGARRRALVAPDVARKLFHVGVGVSAIPTVLYAETSGEAATPYFVLAVVLYASFRFELFHALEDDGASLGSVFLPLSAAVLLIWFWEDRRAVALAGILAAGLGDSFAAIVGRRLGTRKFRTLGHARSMEGTLTLFLVSGVAMAPTLAIIGGLDPHQAVAFALISATVAASVETISVYGLDNVVVPVATAGTLATLIRFSQ